MFNSAKEYIAAMLEGRKFNDLQGTRPCIAYYRKSTYSFVLELSDGSSHNRRSFTAFANVTEIFDNWYDDPTNIGKLCWFWDNGFNELILGELSKYTYNTTNKPFTTTTEKYYENAKPLTDEQLTVIQSIEHIKSCK